VPVWGSDRNLTINRNFWNAPTTSDDWFYLGTVDDILLVLLGGIPNQAILQHALACETAEEGRFVMFLGSLGAILLAVPAAAIANIAILMGES
jgi:hypothetical protein